MNTQQTYQSLLEQCDSGTQVIKKLGSTGMIMQICIMMCINGWKHAGVPYYAIGVPLLFCLSIYFLVKDFITMLQIEKNMTQLIVKGVALEAQEGSKEKPFHQILYSFNLTNIVTQRSLINVTALGAVGYFMLDFVNVCFPSIHISHWILSLFAFIPSVIASKLYYDSLKELDETKERIFATQSP